MFSQYYEDFLKIVINRLPQASPGLDGHQASSSIVWHVDESVSRNLTKEDAFIKDKACESMFKKVYFCDNMSGASQGQPGSAKELKPDSIL